MKIVPPFRPAPNSLDIDSPGSGSSPEKTGNRHAVSSSSTNDEKLPLASTPSQHSGSRSITSTVAGIVGDYNTSAKKTGSNNSISPDIDSSSKHSKNNKKSSGSHSSGKSSDSSISSKSSNNNPNIAQPVLTPATFSTVPTRKSIDGKDGDEKTFTESNDGSRKSGKENESSSNKEDNFTVKLERVDNPLLKGGSSSKKDFSTLQLKEVVTAALDRPMSSSKYDHASPCAGLASGIDPPGGGASSTSSSHSSRHSHHGEKPAPPAPPHPAPDIKPHVTLTLLTTSGGSSKNKSVTSGSSSGQFHGSYGQKYSSSGPNQDLDPKLPSSSKHSSSDMMNSNEIPLIDKSVVPAKRSR